MADVVTLTMNPAIDLSVSVERVTPFLVPYIVTASKVSAIFWWFYAGPVAVPATLHRRVGRSAFALAIASIAAAVQLADAIGDEQELRRLDRRL